MSNLFSIKQFNETAIDDYFRSYLFKVSIVNSSEEFKCEWTANTATPVMVTSSQLIDYMHTQVKRSGKTLPQQWQVSVRDDSLGNAFNYFNGWRNSIYPHMTSGLPEYKRVALIYLFNSAISNAREYAIYGVWPMEVGSITLDYESEGISIFPVTLSFDFFEAR